MGKPTQHNDSASLEQAAKAKKIFKYISEEVFESNRKHPDWPDDLNNQIAIVSEQAGLLVRAGNKYTWQDGTLNTVKERAEKVAAMCVRLLMNLP